MTAALLRFPIKVFSVPSVVKIFRLFKKNSRKLQDGFAPILVLSTPLRWLKRILGPISDANSRTGSRVEQSETSRTTVRSVEITVETDEMIQLEKVTSTSSAGAVAEPAEGNGDCAGGKAVRMGAVTPARDPSVD